MGKLGHAATATILALTLASAAAEVRAQGTGADLLKQCRGEHKVYCAGYIAGLYDGVATYHLLDGELDICLPVRRGTGQSSISYTQMVQIYVEWATANMGQIGHIDRFIAVRQALSESFPCQEIGAGPSTKDPNFSAQATPITQPSAPSQAGKSRERTE